LTKAGRECLINKRFQQSKDILEEKTVTSRNHTVITFRSYPFQIGQKIYIEDGPRHGDWEVIGVTDRKVTFRCPISHREFTWDRFCYFMDERINSPWPHAD
jgi:hypothetical protein